MLEMDCQRTCKSFFAASSSTPSLAEATADAWKFRAARRVIVCAESITEDHD
jgi:hypothetical protein